jgi:hypothetical protein
MLEAHFAMVKQKTQAQNLIFYKQLQIVMTFRMETSYNLKHRAERATGDYFCNGAMIAAALYLRVPVKIFDDTPNPGIGVSTTCPVYQSAAGR